MRVVRFVLAWLGVACLTASLIGCAGDTGTGGGSEEIAPSSTTTTP